MEILRVPQDEATEQAADIDRVMRICRVDEAVAVQLLFEAAGDDEGAARALAEFEVIRPDDNARDRAIRLARSRSEIADHAAEPIAIYDLNDDASTASETDVASDRTVMSGPPSLGGESR